MRGMTNVNKEGMNIVENLTLIGSTPNPLQGDAASHCVATQLVQMLPQQNYLLLRLSREVKLKIH